MPEHREINLSDQIYDAFLGALAELLAIRQAANEARRHLREQYDETVMRGSVAIGVPLPDRKKLRSLAFDLASAHVETFKKLTEAGKSHTDILLGAIRDERKQAGRRRAAGDRRQELLRLGAAGGSYLEEFKISNATGRKDALLLPQVIVFRSQDGTQSFFVRPEYALARGNAGFNGLESPPPRISLEADEEVRIRLGVPSASVVAGTTYLAETAVSLASGRVLQLFLEVTGAR